MTKRQYCDTGRFRAKEVPVSHPLRPSIRLFAGVATKLVDRFVGAPQTGAPEPKPPRLPSQVNVAAEGAPASSVLSERTGSQPLRSFRRGDVIRHVVTSQTLVVDGLLGRSVEPGVMLLCLDAYNVERTIDWVRVWDFEGWRKLDVVELALDPGLRHHIRVNANVVGRAILTPGVG